MKNQKLGWISCKCGSVSLKSSMFQTLELWTNIQLRAASKRQIFSENHSRFQRTSNREKLTLKFSTICSSLFLIRKSGFSMACGAELLICFLLSQYNHILLGEKEEEVEINGSICVRFDTRCQPQGSSGCSRNCSLGPNWGLWDGLLTSGGGLSLSLA